MITNIRKNRIGTVSFDGKFDGMRKSQDFIVYPMHDGNDTSTALVQSDTPRTDAAIVSAEFIRREMDYYEHKFVLADLSRQFEREAAQLRAQCEAHSRDADRYMLKAEQLRADRDALAEALREIASLECATEETDYMTGRNQGILEAQYYALQALSKHGGGNG